MKGSFPTSISSHVDQRGVDPQESQQAKLDQGVIGLPSQQPERGAQGAFQLTNPDVEELAESER